MRDMYFAGLLLLLLVAAYLFTVDASKMKLLEYLITGTFGALLALVQARARHTETGDIVEKKVEVERGAPLKMDAGTKGKVTGGAAKTGQVKAAP